MDDVYTCVCIYRKLNHCAIHLKLTQHCKSIVRQFKKEILKNLNNKI